jgi:hypothetical protein
MNMEEGPGGRPGKGEVNEAIAWYESLFEENGEEEEEQEQDGEEKSE